jgi:hypothetical protein
MILFSKTPSRWVWEPSRSCRKCTGRIEADKIYWFSHENQISLA